MGSCGAGGGGPGERLVRRGAPTRSAPSQLLPEPAHLARGAAAAVADDLPARALGDDDAAVLHGHVRRPGAVDRVVLEQVGHGLDRGDVVEMDQLEGLGPRPGQADGQAAWQERCALLESATARSAHAAVGDGRSSRAGARGIKRRQRCSPILPQPVTQTLTGILCRAACGANSGAGAGHDADKRTGDEAMQRQLNPSAFLPLKRVDYSLGQAPHKRYLLPFLASKAWCAVIITTPFRLHHPARPRASLHAGCAPSPLSAPFF